MVAALLKGRAARYRDRAAEIRSVACSLENAAAREELCLIATEYERLAEHLECLVEPAVESAADGDTAGYWATC